MRSKNTRYSEEFKRQIVKEVEEIGNTSLVAFFILKIFKIWTKVS